MLIKECPDCGYVSKEIDSPTPITIEFLKSPEYLTCNGTPFQSKLARQFYRRYIIDLALGRRREAFFDLIHASWCCDGKEEELSVLCKELALPLVIQLISANDRDKDVYLVMKAEILRRTGRIQELISEYENMKFPDERPNIHLTVILYLAKKGDTRAPLTRSRLLFKRFSNGAYP